MSKDDVEKEDIIETEKAVIRIHGEPNIAAWAKKVKQVLDDLEAGRYNNEKDK